MTLLDNGSRATEGDGSFRETAEGRAETCLAHHNESGVETECYSDQEYSRERDVAGCSPGGLGDHWG